MTTSNGTTVMVQGRIVWVNGDLFKGQRKLNFNTKQPEFDAQGNPIIQYGFGLAVPKEALSQTGDNQPGWVWRAMHEEAYKLFPNGQIPPSFAMKYKDGDGIDDKGVSFAQRKGYAGHIVLACTTNLPITFVKWENGTNVKVNEGIKCGDYVNVQLNVKSHPAKGQGKAGLYLNPYAVQFLGYGEEIINTPSGDQIFGNSMPAVPQGASAAPIAPQGMIVPQQYQQQMPTPAIPAIQATPHYGVLPQQYQQQMPTPAIPANMPHPGFAQSVQPQGMPAIPGFPRP